MEFVRKYQRVPEAGRGGTLLVILYLKVKWIELRMLVSKFK